jgi:murE/murF fusion protein
LSDLLAGLDYETGGSLPLEQIHITAVTGDSREVTEQALFVATSGGSRDGHDFLDAAIHGGAGAVVIEKQSGRRAGLENRGVAVIEVADGQELLGEIAARFNNSPAKRLTMIGITGTNGKTTVSYLLEQALRQCGVSVGVIGTVDYRYPDRTGEIVQIPAPFTTPDPVRLHGLLAEMAEAGVTHLVMEVSSHALQQKRLGPIRFSLGIFTNFSQDHLDYHQDMEHYFTAKSLFFSDFIAPEGTAVVMVPGPEQAEQKRWADRVVGLCQARDLSIIRCGPKPGSGFSLNHVSCTLNGLELSIHDELSNTCQISTQLIGRFNVDNLLVSVAALKSLGIEMEQAANLLSEARPAPGRLQKVDLADRPGGQPTVLVDYAHTPDALEKALKAVGELEHNNLLCVVGCGGDRDRGKRPLMGVIAATLSDIAIITDDNPRSEDPAWIRSEMIAGVRASGITAQLPDWLYEREPNEKGCVEIPGREQAIKAGISAADVGDIVLVAGKGHEKYQLTHDGKHFFDDCLVAQEASLQWDLQSVSAATSGTIEVAGYGRNYGCVSTDSRKLGPGDIFVALQGDTFDGHDFIGQAVQNGVGCIVCSDPADLQGYAVDVVRVADTERALGDLAHWRRQVVKGLQNPLVIALTGSSGKTTVKEMTAAICAEHWPDGNDQPANRVLKTGGNYNNLIGLPLTLLPVSAHHAGVVLEMGMNRPGEIGRLTEIADPDIGCIINVHGAHLEGLGTIEGVAKAKGELFEQTSENAIHVINCDDELVVGRGRQQRQRTVGFAVTEQGRQRDPEVWAEKIISDARGHLFFTLHVEDRQAAVTIHAPGLHNGSNACGAAAICHAAGIGFDTIVRGLESFRSTVNRMESLQTPSGFNLLNDTYNANPASMESALRTLSSLPARMRVAVLGDMLELGAASAELHEKIGRLAAECDIDALYLVGNFSIYIRNGAVAAGLAQEKIVMSEDKDRAVDWMKDLQHSGRLQPGDWILVKASRGLALESVVQQLLDNL